MSKDYIRGPWQVGPVDDTCITDDNGEAVAYVEGDYDASPYEMEARARLIAAAPELLDALKEAREMVEYLRGRGWPDEDGRYEDWVHPLDKVIAKASPVYVPDEPHRPMNDHISGHVIRERERRY